MDVEVDGADAVTVAAGESTDVAVSVLSAATLTATASDGYAFTGWTLAGESGSLACAEGDPSPNPCTLALGSFTADATATAAFEAVQRTLRVSAGAGGSVAVTVGGVAAGSATAGSSTDVAVTVDDAVALTAMPTVGARFVRWMLSDGLACQGRLEASPCMLDPVGADGSAAAEFSSLPDSVTWTGPGTVTMDGSTLTAVPYADGAFEAWQGGPCDGSAALECARSPLPNAGYPVAVFRPFVAAGIKSLAFGLGYQGASPHSFQVSLRRGTDAVYELPPALDGLPGSGQASASLAVPVHLLPWGRGGYLTEACDASNVCEAANGGERALAQAVSRVVTGYVKAPNAGTRDQYGALTFQDGSSIAFSSAAFGSLELSADGDTLVVGAFREDSSYTGAFAPEDPNYQAALASSGSFNSGAAYVYRRSDAGQWVTEAYIKAPVAGASDWFGGAVALSGDGGTLAVGALGEGSASTGTFVPSGDENSGYRRALESDAAAASGAVTVYRRSDAGRWALEAFVKAPVADTGDYFGFALALDSSGTTLAVGAPGEDSASTGTFAPDGAGYQAALDSGGASDSGAVTVYRRSTLADAWAIEAFVKAPVAGAGDRFGIAVALDSSGATLAVGVPGEDSSATGAFAPGDEGYRTALDSGGASDSGAVTVYRRSAPTDTWAIEAFVKAPVAGASDRFGAAAALSADGATLAVGAPYEDSASTGTFVPSDDPESPYRRALASNHSPLFEGGAVTVYRRSDADQWGVEAFVKAPKLVFDGNSGARFGFSLDLSSNGVVMAVGSSGEDSSFSGVFVPDDPGYQAALDDDDGDRSGAAYVYRRHRDTEGDPWSWEAAAFVKAPNTGDGDEFGTGVALSGDGATLAVVAPYEDGAALDGPVDGGRIPDSGGVNNSGAVYLY